MKLALSIALAKYLHDDPRGEGRTLKDLVIPALLTVMPVLLILRQPDLGTAIILMLVFVSIASLMRLRWKSVVALFSIVRRRSSRWSGSTAARTTRASDRRRS